MLRRLLMMLLIAGLGAPAIAMPPAAAAPASCHETAPEAAVDTDRSHHKQASSQTADDMRVGHCIGCIVAPAPIAAATHVCFSDARFQALPSVEAVSYRGRPATPPPRA